MIRKATAYVLLLLLGLYLPAASMSVHLCVKPTSGDDLSCVIAAPDCCEEDHADAKPCCEEQDCCIDLPSLPDGMEPQLIAAPAPVALPAPLLLADDFSLLPMREHWLATSSDRAPPLPPGAPIRIAHGVWRL
ncbi:hypothetical protein ACFQY0_10165 [Haloferula chungangensis]|uniref:Secreted protein n=1 Tax=Haloferula chungangensis TaxID=1048331 RepID=A0ABW2L7Q3_9BACT